MLVTLLAIGAAWPSRHGQFLDGDDMGLIRDHYLVNHPSWPHAYDLLGMVHGDLYQPLPMLTFMANYALHGANPRGYHLVNIYLHAINAMLVLLLIRRIVRDDRAGLLTAAMFALHPMQMEPVAWVTGRIILLATTFALLTLLAFVYRRETPGRAWSWAAVLAWCLSLVSKVMPAVPLAAVWCDFFTHRQRTRRWYATTAALFVLGGGLTYAAYHTTRRLEFFQLMQAETTTPLPIRMLLATGYYFRNYLWPTRLSAWSPPPDHVTWTNPAVLASIGGWIALLLVMAISWRRCRAAFVGLGLFMLLLSPFVAAMTARTFLTADRYMYAPMIGLHLAVAAWALRAWDAMRIRRAAAAWATASIVCAAVGFFWAREAHAVCRVFRDSLAQARRTVRLFPDDVRAWVELARAHVRANDPAKALAVVEEQRRRWPDNPELAAEAGQASWMRGDFRRADAEFARAVAGRPTNHQAKYYWGLTLQELGLVHRARVLWREAIDEKNHFLPAATALARSFRDAGELEEAIEWYERAISLNDHHRDAHFELALVHMSRQDWPAAMEQLRAVLRIDSDDRQAQLNLATCLARSGAPAEALKLYDALRAAVPDNDAVRFNRAALLASMQRSPEAETEYREILRLRPGHRAAAIGLNELLLTDRRAGDIANVWKTVCNSPNPPPDAHAWLAFSGAVAATPASAPAQSASGPASTQPGAILWAWATVWRHFNAASEADLHALRAAIDAAAALRPRTSSEHEQLRVVVLTLLARRDERPDDAATTDALMHAMLAQENVTFARQCASGILAQSRDNAWRARAQAVLNPVAKK